MAGYLQYYFLICFGTRQASVDGPLSRCMVPHAADSVLVSSDWEQSGPLSFVGYSLILDQTLHQGLTSSPQRCFVVLLWCLRIWNAFPGMRLAVGCWLAELCLDLARRGYKVAHALPHQDSQRLSCPRCLSYVGDEDLVRLVIRRPAVVGQCIGMEL
jgi:hypothetical protein